MVKQLWMAAVLATAVASAHAASNAIDIDKQFVPAAQAAALLKSDASVKLNGVRRVAVTAFDVEFFTQGSASASATEIGKSGTTSVTSYVKLTGVDSGDFQAIADQLYTNFAAQLGAAGIELVPLETIRKSASYQKIAASGKPAPLVKQHNKETSTVVTAEGRPVIGFGLTTRGGGSPLAALSNFGAVATSIANLADLQKELDATLLEVRFVVRFVNLESSSGSFLNRISGKAEVKGKVSPTIAAEDTMLMMVGPAGAATYRLQRPLRIDAAAVPELKNTTSVAANVGLAVLSMAIGTGSSSQVSEHEAVADRDAFRTLVADGLGKTSAMMSAQVSALK